MTQTDRPKRVKKYKTTIRVLDNGSLQGVCSCGWEQPMAVLQSSGLSEAISAVNTEVASHTHIPAKKKGRKKK